MLFGLAGLAVTQPVLDLFGNNPTFFVAGSYGRRGTLAFALVVTVVPGLVAFLVTAVFGVFGRRAAAIAHGLGVALLAGLFGLVVCRTLGVDGVAAAVAVAVVVGVGAAVAEARLALARRYLSWLALGNVAFLLLFVFVGPTAELLRQSSYVAPAGAVIPALEGPVTVVVLDEFPLATILRPDGTINEVRYPHLAALAEETTWFRNASSEGSTTFLQVPEILTGVRSDEDDLPTIHDHPRNLMSVLGGRYPVNAYEVVTDLCPPEACGPAPRGPLRQALSDAWVVYRHRVLPAAWRDGLPPVDLAWGEFGGLDAGDAAPETPPVTTPSSEVDPMARLDEVPAEDRGKVGQSAAVRRQVQLITADPSINVIHVLIPHHAYQLTPWGVASTATWLPNELPGADNPRHERAFAELYALQAMQVAAVDQLIGDMVAHLKEVGAWEGSTLVITSDHGIDITPPNFTRRIRDDNEAGVLRVPLFVKAPGQTGGEVRDEPATTLDVVPSLVDLLDIETGWEFDGHSLFDRSPPGYERALRGDDFEDGLDYVVRQQTNLRPGDGWSSVVGIGEHGDLVGTAVADHAVAAPSALTWTYDHAEELADPALAGGWAPVQLRGTVTAPGDEPPAGDLVIALDGVISGTTGGWKASDGGGWAFTGVLGPEIEGGADEVVAYEVERSGGTMTLHPLREG